MRGVLALFVAVSSLAFTGSALAADFTSSTLTAPTDNSFPLYNAASPNMIHVEGTTDPGGNADLVCFFGATRKVLLANVTVTAGVISTDVPLQPLTTGVPEHMCTLRAIPTGDAANYPPGSASAFAGPDLGIGLIGTNAITDPGVNFGLVNDYRIAQAQPEAQTDFRSLGSCGLDYSYLFDPITFDTSDALFYCNSWLSDRDGCATGSGTCKVANRSEILVDGSNAFVANSAAGLYDDGTHKSRLLAGFPTLNFDKAIDPLTGDVSINESDQVARCSPNPSVFHAPSNDPAWASDCSSFVPAGVKVDRTIAADRKGRRATLTDVWSSTDGAAHQVELRYDEDFNGEPGTGASFQYSWLGPAYSTPGFGDVLAGPTVDAPVSLSIDGNASSADTFQFPQGTATYSDPPSEVYWYYKDGTGGTSATFKYTRTIPAAGSVTIARSYIIGQTKAEVAGQIPAELARLGRPKVAITSPATVSDPALLVTGTAADPGGGITGLTVNGDAVSVAADGSWTKAVLLNEGENTVTAVATDGNGNTGGATAKIAYTPKPPAQPVPVPTATDRTAPVLGLAVVKTRLGALLRKGLTVRARSSEPCTFTVTLLLGSKSVGKASGRLTAAGTKKVVVKLSKKAKKQLAKAKRARLTVKLSAKDSAGNSARKSVKVTIRR